MEDANKNNNWHYNKYLRNYAHENRSNLTKAEACLWKYVLKAGQMKGYNFRRQRPVMNYIADFMCKELMLVIEVDGLTHGDEKVILKDVKKDEALQQCGFSVLRFYDSEILEGIDGVKQRIQNFIEEFEKINGFKGRKERRSVSPPPAPPPAGDTRLQ